VVTIPSTHVGASLGLAALVQEAPLDHYGLGLTKPATS